MECFCWTYHGPPHEHPYLQAKDAIYAIVQESKWHRKARVFHVFVHQKCSPTALVPPWHSAAYQLAVSASWLERCFGQKNSSFATKCELVLNIRIGILSLSIKSMTRKTEDGSLYLAIFGCSINFPTTKFQLCLKFLSPSKTQRCPVAIAKEVPLSGYQKSPRKNPLACLFFHGSKRRLHPPQFCADLQLQQPRAWESKEEEWQGLLKKYHLLFHACHSDDVVACPSMELTLWLM